MFLYSSHCCEGAQFGGGQTWFFIGYNRIRKSSDLTHTSVQNFVYINWSFAPELTTCVQNFSRILIILELAATGAVKRECCCWVPFWPFVIQSCKLFLCALQENFRNKIAWKEKDVAIKTYAYLRITIILLVVIYPVVNEFIFWLGIPPFTPPWIEGKVVFVFVFFLNDLISFMQNPVNRSLVFY